MLKTLFSAAGKRAGEEHRGRRELEHQRARRLGQEERRPILPAQRRRSAESQVGCFNVCIPNLDAAQPVNSTDSPLFWFSLS